MASIVDYLFRRKKTASLARVEPVMALSASLASGGKSSSVLDVPLPKPGKAGAQSYPSIMRSTKPSATSAFQSIDSSYYSTDLTTLRASSANTRDFINQLVQASPEVGASVNAYIRVGIPATYTAIARNMDGTFNRDATILVQAMLTRMDFLGNQDGKSFDDAKGLRSCCESMARDLRVYGGCAMELVLDKARLPYKLQPISFSQIFFYPTPDGKAITPKQQVAGQYIDLDIPTFFIVTLDQNLLKAYPDSPMETAVQGVMFSFDFMNDVRRVVKRAIQPRYDLEMDEEKFRKSIPPDIVGDSEKMAAYMNEVISAAELMMSTLNPEDAIVHFDAIGITVIDHGNTNLAGEYQQIDSMIQSKLTSGTKTMPTVIGAGDATANVASTETLLFTKSVEGAVTFKLNDIISQGLTQGVRMMGQDVYVEFQYERLELRPELEQESFKALKQSRVLEQLSLGFLEDDEASILLTGSMTPASFQPLSGTMFYNAKTTQVAGDGYNGASNDGSAINKSLKPSTPTGGARGQNKKSGSRAA